MFELAVLLVNGGMLHADLMRIQTGMSDGCRSLFGVDWTYSTARYPRRALRVRLLWLFEWSWSWSK